MELGEIVQRYAEAFAQVDARTGSRRANARTGEMYQPGLASLGEQRAWYEADAMWETLHPGELLEPRGTRLSVAYPRLDRAKCDHVFSTSPGVQPEWAIEGKFISFVGNNGNNNDYGVGKMLSPYLKDRGVLHDAARLRDSNFSRRVAVVAYAFNYDSDTCDASAWLHPFQENVVMNIRKVISKNGTALHARPIIDLLDAILGLRGFLRGPRVEQDFDAWRNPAGGRGTVFGWEIRRPHLETDYDPRHPW